MSVLTLTADDELTLALALDDWLELCEPGDDPTSQARYAHTARLREMLDAGRYDLGRQS